MHQLIRRFSIYCVNSGIIEEEMQNWFSYALEKRVTTVISSLVFILIATFLSNPWTAFAYLGSFYYLRKRTGGFHAKSFMGCLCFSILLEFAFLMLLLPVLTTYIAYILNVISYITIFSLSPFNHPNMHLTAQEISACRTSARIRISVLTASVIISFVFAMKNVGYGITLGNTMTALLLVIVNNKKESEESSNET